MFARGSNNDPWVQGLNVVFLMETLVPRFLEMVTYHNLTVLHDNVNPRQYDVVKCLDFQPGSDKSDMTKPL